MSAVGSSKGNVWISGKAVKNGRSIDSELNLPSVKALMRDDEFPQGAVLWQGTRIYFGNNFFTGCATFSRKWALGPKRT